MSIIKDKNISKKNLKKDSGVLNVKKPLKTDALSQSITQKRLELKNLNLARDTVTKELKALLNQRKNVSQNLRRLSKIKLKEDHV